MRKVFSAFVLGAVALTIGCYHATIETGLQPNGEMITQKWATGWIHGLVPPKTVEAASKCPNGVARVETQLSFLNQLATAVTFGIYSPMRIEVACAGARSDAGAPTLKGSGDVEQSLSEAAKLSLAIGQAVYVAF